MKEAVIVAGVRTAIGRAPRGVLHTTRPDEMAATVIAELLRKAEGLPVECVEDVILGCAFPEAEQGFNVARVAALRAGLPNVVPGQTVNRFCSSGLQSIAIASQQIISGMGRCLIACGAESMSMVPMVGKNPAPNPWLAENHPEAYLGMGLTAEQVAKEFKVSRQDQDAFAFRSHQRAIAAQDAGRFSGEIVPLTVETVSVVDGKPQRQSIKVDRDEGPRRDTSLQALSALKPAFSAKGSVTAGNSSQTSDGAAAVLVMERGFAEELALRPLVRFVSFAVAGVRPEVMGIGPALAVPKALRLAGLEVDDLDLIELNEAFAAQAIAVIRELGLDEDKVNVNGGAIALGHPLGCTGSKLTVQLINELKRRGGQYGLVTMCIGGGMGAAGIFENLA